MEILKCEKCGGTVNCEPGATVGVCEKCGMKQTLPRPDDGRQEEQWRIVAKKIVKKRRITAAVIASAVVLCIALLIVLFTVIIPAVKYSIAVDLYNAG